MNATEARKLTESARDEKTEEIRVAVTRCLYRIKEEASYGKDAYRYFVGCSNLANGVADRIMRELESLGYSCRLNHGTDSSIHISWGGK